MPLHPQCQAILDAIANADGPTIFDTRDPEEGYSVFGLNCGEQLSTGFFSYIAEIRPRRILLIDEERGLVFGVFMFQHPGRTRRVTIRDVGEMELPAFAKLPFTLIAGELFKIKQKKIREIEAVMTKLPYRSKTGWDD